MKYVFLALLLSGIAAVSLYAQPVYEGGFNPNLSFSQYLEQAYPHYDKPLIYVFYNDVNMSCQNCAATIDLIEQVYNQNYQNVYDFFVIDYGNDQEYNFIEVYHLSKPLEVVLVQVSDGEMLGYKKLENLNYQISGPISFADQLTYQINSFLRT